MNARSRKLVTRQPRRRGAGPGLTLPAALGVIAAACLAPRVATAQILNAPPPNVLLLVDTSGSMERMPNGALPAGCTGAGPSMVCKDVNRWGILVQSLTGTFLGPSGYTYKPTDRVNNPKFRAEYQINGKAPYDDRYFLPYHRPATYDGVTFCTKGPYKLPGTATNGVGVVPGLGAGGNADDFPADAIGNYSWADIDSALPGSRVLAAKINTCTFAQSTDGQIDAAKDYIRFGLMTFDGDPDGGCGVTPGGPGCQLGAVAGTSAYTSTNPKVDTANPFLGHWSYVRSAGAVSGNLPACAAIPFEVGARSKAAPPWEGRQVPFPVWTATAGQYGAVADQIKGVLLATRPYGATPIAGMMHDAMDYLRVSNMGPNGQDPLARSGCRHQSVVIMTDGAPNMDLRPACGGAGGNCPFGSDKTTRGIINKITKDLFDGSAAAYGGVNDVNRRVETFVVGFSVNGTTGADGFPAGLPAGQRTCKGWYDSLPAPSPMAFQTACSAEPGAAAGSGTTADACCTLNEMAIAGSNPASPRRPFFAESATDLAAAFAEILAGVATNVNTRTVPVVSPSYTSAGVTQSGVFTASFDPKNLTSVWAGNVKRSRTTCTLGGGVRKYETFDTSKGDDFAQNMAQSTSDRRNILVVLPPQVSTKVTEGNLTMRPYGPTTPPGDKVLTVRPAEVITTDLDTSIVSDVGYPSKLDPDTMNVKSTSCPATGLLPALTNPNLCGRVMWGFATSTVESQMFGSPVKQFNQRCLSSATCNALGGIYRSTPRIVGPPSGFNRDEAYREFANKYSTRPQVLYTASIDGLLHAFDTSVKTKKRNELFTFVPPAVMPSLPGNYPGGQKIILDGVPVVADTVYDRTAIEASDATRWYRWHTTLVAGLGMPTANGNGGYYALEVTDPRVMIGATTNWQQPTPGQGNISEFEKDLPTRKKGPHFLWQLTTVDEVPGKGKGKGKGLNKKKVKQYDLFGDRTGTPAITTVVLGTGAAAREVGVAILPGGGESAGPSAGFCPRSIGSGPNGNQADDFSSAAFWDLSANPTVKRRGNVRKWAANCKDAVASRNLLVVRLDTGEILRIFGRVGQDIPDLVDPVGTKVPFDSPLVGTPVVYPSGPGQIGQKVFIGDADGTVWRLDISNSDPTTWYGSLFWDTQNTDVIGAGLTAQQQADRSQPILVPPIVSLDDRGNLVLSVATGDQDTLVDTTPGQNFVYSLTESPTFLAAGSKPVGVTANWWHAMTGGERVTGPMTVFDKTHYFATFKPPASVSACTGGHAYIYGWHYTQRRTVGVPANGGTYRYPAAAPAQREEPFAGVAGEGQVIPGVSIVGSLPCFDGNDLASYGEYGAKLSATEYSLFVTVAAGSTSGSKTYGGGSQTNLNVGAPKGLLPSTTEKTRVDSWVAVVE